MLCRLDYPCPYVQDASIELLAALNPFVTTDLYVGKSESVRILQVGVIWDYGCLWAEC